jgi:uncharacterized membrane protein
MKKMILVAVALASAVSLSGCYTPQDRAVGGAAIGGATGATLGAAATGRAGGAVAGGLIGAATGAVVGASTAPRPCARTGYDYYGNPVCLAYN